MGAAELTKAFVLDMSRDLPSFPIVIRQILDTLDDPDANLRVLASYIQHDPVIAAKTIYLANTVSLSRGRSSVINNVYSATSILGMTRVREIAMVSAMSAYMKEMIPLAHSPYWEHSVVVGVCAEELAAYASVKVSAAEALLAGLLHDIGELWLLRYRRDDLMAAMGAALRGDLRLDDMEQERFGASHSQIGAWLAEGSMLPSSVVSAIRKHHDPDAGGFDELAAVVHVAEVLSNALDLPRREENRVTYISEAACRRIGVDWNPHVRPLFGRMEGRARHATTFFVESTPAVTAFRGPPNSSRGHHESI